ncbi:hypothetical protein Patl1_15859 [Pistacia atlantica]|uniref:Uncharacterized protein n=1 Tax=Pistacia atlantica TaxID=434234 RepID=A0ACC1BBC1_9ROSI|nr:hypothetical protein Patl1_15859 [Pistacia atlantica]
MDLFIFKVNLMVVWGALVACVGPGANWMVVEAMATVVGREAEDEGAAAKGLVTTVNKIVI